MIFKSQMVLGLKQEVTFLKLKYLPFFSTDVQQPLANKEEDPLEQWDWVQVQVQPESPHIKEEQGEVWTDGGQLQGPADTDDEEKPQFLQPYQSQTETMDAAAGEDCGGSEPARYFNPNGYLQQDTHDSDDWEKISDLQSCLNFKKNTFECSSDEESEVCGQQFTQESSFNAHTRIHTEEKPFNCSVCSKTFIQKIDLTHHMAVHAGKNRYSCNDCGEGFTWPDQIKNHNCERERNGIQTAVKQFICSKCGKRCCKESSFQAHMRLHSEGQHFTCSVCGKAFLYRVQVVRHMRSHNVEKPFGCPMCGRRFAIAYNLTTHLRVHTGEKPFTCSVCGASFSRRHSVVKHMTRHTGEKPFSCSTCGKTFARRDLLKKHLAVHARKETVH